MNHFLPGLLIGLLGSLLVCGGIAVVIGRRVGAALGAAGELCGASGRLRIGASRG